MNLFDLILVILFLGILIFVVISSTIKDMGWIKTILLVAYFYVVAKYAYTYGKDD